MTDRELMQQALEALTAYDGTNGASQRKRVLAALRDRLAQSDQEPVGYVSESGKGAFILLGVDLEDDTPLYTAPPQHEWQGLTVEEIIKVIHPLVMANMADEATDYEIAKAIEQALKEKNT